MSQNELTVPIHQERTDSEEQFGESRQGQGNACCTLLRNTGLLTWKNFIVQKRSWKSSVCQLVSPFVLCLILYMWQLVANSFNQRIDLNPEIAQANYLEKCKPGAGQDSCTTLGIAVIGDYTGWVNHTIDFILNETGYKMNEEVKVIYHGANISEVDDYLTSNWNQTQIVAIFCTSQFTLNVNISNKNVPFPISCTDFTPYPVIELGKIVHYQLLVNATLIPNGLFSPVTQHFPKNTVALNLKLLIDNGLLSYFAKDPAKPPKMTVSYEDYPHAPNRFFQGYDVVSAQGTLYFFIAPMITFMIFIGEIVREKEYRLRQGMQVVGVSALAYWSSWLLTSITFSAGITLSLQLSGYIFQFDFFLRTPFLLTFVTFFFFAMAMQMLMFWLCTMVSSIKYANTLSYGFLLFAIVIQLFLSNRTIILFLFQDNAADWITWVTRFLVLYPPFNFSKVMGDFSHIASNHYNNNEGRWIDGTEYQWANYTQTNVGVLPGKKTYTAYSSYDSTLLLLGDMAVFGLLAWYCDHTIASNRGTGDSLLFFLTPKYWGCRRSKGNRISSRGALSRSSSVLDAEQKIAADSVEAEKAKVQKRSQDGVPALGIRIEGVSKTYKKYPFGIKSKKDVHAVRGVYLEVDEGELLGLLGHNGAGKTTLISMLTGILEPSAGKALLAGNDLVEDIEDVKNVIGVCAQFDILWNEMTADEHLYLFAKLRNIPASSMENTIVNKLKQVNLLDVRHSQVQTFSGGMKRRLSMAICSLGEPRIIFLDEPTTGMDPKSRREVWDLIQEFKKNRVVILTTHAMEEADILSDRIAVIVDGTLSCIGTPLNLKNTYGQGYKLSVIIEPSESEEAQRLIKARIPSSILVDESGGSLVFAVPLARINELGQFFKILEGKQGDSESVRIRSIIKDWGLSGSTLEEVFMKVTGKKVSKQRGDSLTEKKNA